MQKVQKRNGSIVSFDERKIERAIRLALKSVGRPAKKAPKLVSRVSTQLEEQYIDRVPTVEQIQDMIEHVLIENKEETTAKSFILYRDRRSQAREDQKVTVQVEQTIDEYLHKLDWRVNANSNQGYSLGGMILNTSGKVTANYWLSHIYPQQV